MTTERAKRKLSAILSADVKGYSRLMGEDEVGTVRTLKEYRELMSKLVREYRGRVVDSPGDNVLAEFASVVDALECSIEIQKTLKDKNAALPDNRKMEFRIGVNLGDVIEDEDRVYGDGVNIAARIEGLAEPGGICISGSAFEQVKSKLKAGFEYLGEQSVKNIAERVRVYRVLMKPEAEGSVIYRHRRDDPRHKRSTTIIALLILIVGVAAFSFWNFHWRAPKIEPASREKMAFPLPDKPSIAVLPFVNISGDPQQESFSDGLTEDIITSLSKMPNIFVIARQSSFAYKGKPVKVKQVAEDLGVQYVLEGSVQRSGDRVRITAQLIDAVKGYHVWSERYDKEVKDVFALQDKITLETLKALDVNLSRGDVSRVHGMGTENLEAYIKLLQGREIFQNQTKESNIQARQLIEEAIRLDPNYAIAYFFLAAVTGMDISHGISKSPKESRMKAIELCQKAISLDESCASAYAYMGIQYSNLGDHEKGIASCERAIEIAPNFTDAYVFLALVLNTAGRSEDAIPAIEKAFRFNPLNPPFSHYLAAGRTYYLVGRYEDALRWSKELLSHYPNNIFGHQLLVLVNSALGRDDEARAAAGNLLRIHPDFTTQIYARAFPRKDLDRDLELLRKAGLPDKPPLPLPDKPSIAVLPFVNMSDDKSQAYFSDGLTEEIITALSKTPKLFVIARNSTFVYKGKPVNVQQVSRELGVKYVLEGSVRRSGDQLRITAQLIDGTTGNHLWAERYDREMKDVFAIQDEVTMKILTSLQVTLTEGESARSFERGTDSLEAYLKTIEGRELMFALNKDDNALARRKFDEAIALDPNFARAYAALSLAYTLDFMYRVDPMESLKKAYEFAQKAIALDDGQLLAHGALEFVYGWKRQHEMAIAAGERAVQIAPGCADAYFYLGRALNFACRDEEAVSQLEKAIRMNPFPPGPYYMHLGMSYLSLRQYEKAVTVLKKCINLSPKNISVRRMLTVTYVEMGSLEEARVEAEEILKIDPKFTSKGFEKIVPFKDAEITKRYIEGLRAAGLERDVSGN